MATVDECPCCFTLEDAVKFNTFNNEGFCQAIIDDRRNICGRRANQHPRATATTQGNEDEPSHKRRKVFAEGNLEENVATMVNEFKDFKKIVKFQVEVAIKTKEDVAQIKWRLSFAELCPWLEMAETERSNANNIRGQLFRLLAITDGQEYCWLTGKHRANASQSHVKVAHIIPDSARNIIFEKLRLPYEFKNEIKKDRANFLVLDKSIEYAFDHMVISFVPKDILNPSSLILKFWNDSCDDKEVCVGDADEQAEDIHLHGRVRSVLKDYDGVELKFPEGYSPCLRALSYQALCAYIYNKTKDSRQMDESEPLDFSSQFEGKDEIRKELAGILNQSTKVDTQEENFVNIFFNDGDADISSL